MYAYLLIVTVLLGNGQTATLHQRSLRTFQTQESCIYFGKDTGDTLLEAFARSPKNPKVRASVACHRVDNDA